jgi:hypothetical protein
MSATTVTVTKKTETKPRIKKVKPVETPVETPVSVTQSPADVETEAPIKEKKERPPRLPEKFGKFIQFAYWFMKKYNSETPKVDETEFLNAIAFYGTVDEQTSFVEEFITDAKENKKEIRKNIVAHKKAAMPKKERKPREKKPKLDDDGNEIPPKEKKPKGKKATKEVGNTQDELVNELVRRANSTDIPAEVADQVADEVAKPVKEKKTSVKPKAKKDDNDTKETKVTKETKTKETKTKDTKTKDTKTKTKDTKTKTKVEPQTETNQEQELELDTDVQLIEINGKTYYVDDQDVLYDVDSQEELGTLDRNTMTTTLI